MQFWPTSTSVRTVDLDPDLIASSASGTMLTVNRLSRQAEPSRVRQVQSARRWALDLTELNCKVHATGMLAPGCVAVLVVLRPNGSAICGVPLEEGGVVVLPAGCEIEAVIFPGTAYTGIVLPAALWTAVQETATGMPVHAAGDRPVALRLAPGRARAIRTMLGGLVERLEEEAGRPAQTALPEPLSGFLGSLCEAAAGAEDRYEAIDRSTRNRRRQAARAEAWIRAHLREDISVPALCREIGVSRRQLEYALRTSFDIAPQGFVRLLRLNLARRELLAARGSGLAATTVALACGINHLGRFSQGYRALFGETPSQTLRGEGGAPAQDAPMR